MDRVHPDTLRTELLRRDLGHAADRPLGRRIARQVVRALHPVHRRDVDDRAAAASHHRLDDRAHAEKRPDLVDADDGEIVIERGVDEPREPQDRGVVDQHVETAPGVDDLAPRRPSIADSSVTSRWQVHGSRAQVRRQRLALVVQHVGDGDPRPGVDECARDPGADPAGRPGHQRDLSLQVFHLPGLPKIKGSRSRCLASDVGPGALDQRLEPVVAAQRVEIIIGLDPDQRSLGGAIDHGFKQVDCAAEVAETHQRAGEIDVQIYVLGIDEPASGNPLAGALGFTHAGECGDTKTQRPPVVRFCGDDLLHPGQRSPRRGLLACGIALAAIALHRHARGIELGLDHGRRPLEIPDAVIEAAQPERTQRRDAVALVGLRVEPQRGFAGLDALVEFRAAFQHAAQRSMRVRQFRIERERTLCRTRSIVVGGAARQNISRCASAIAAQACA